MTETLKDPYELIGEMRDDFEHLIDVTAEGESKVWLRSLLNNLDTETLLMPNLLANSI